MAKRTEPNPRDLDGETNEPGRPRRRWLFRGTAIAAAVLLPLAVFLLLPFWELAGRFAEHAVKQPSRLYGQPTVVAVGDLHGIDSVVDELDREGYLDAAKPGASGVSPGLYRREPGRLVVHLRRFLTAQGWDGGREVEIAWRRERVEGLTVAGRAVPAVRLPPPLLASYYGEDLEERWPVTVDEVPEELIDALLAAEDATFFDHPGLSLTGILRAAWVNLTGGEIRQGGSTLTQQLVKNLYLTHERTLGRKTREAVLALMLEARYTKRQILEAYLNEIYLGASDGVNLIGFGAAARAYFSKEPAELDLGEAALLAGMIRAPGLTSPISHPEAARQRRDWVLGRMVSLDWLAEERAKRFQDQPVVAHPLPVVRRGAPYFAQAAQEEAERRFGVAPLEDSGHILFSTLRAEDQRQAEKAVRWGLSALEKGWQKGAGVDEPLQGALVSLDPASGGILAYVGGRDYGLSQFDRAGRARRQAGSAFKPVVFGAAFAAGVAMPSSWVYDSPLTVRLAGREWSPKNYGDDYRGWVTVRTAAEESLNTATARVALEVGLDPIVALARKMGIVSPLEPFPALALGAFEVSPLEMTAVYGTLASGGVRPAVHGLEAILDAEGRWVGGAALPPPERALSPEVAYLVTSTLEGVLDRGTGAGARRQGLSDPLAGKTGTTNGRRDNWFAGYSPERVTVVWVGYDDNARTRLTGARGALPIWARFMLKVRPPGGYSTFTQPPGVYTAVVDPQTGELATEACPEVLTEVYLEGWVPDQVCHLHRGGSERWERRRRREAGDRHPFRRWLERVFGGGG
jgi:penicillin-binding protein 1B